MTQNNLATMVSPTPGATLVSNLENWRDALHSMHSGATRPDYVVPQMMWIDTSETPWVLKVFQGSDDIVLGSLDPSGLLFSPSSVADGSIGTSNIIDGSVTKAKLSTAVQTSLDKADTALQPDGDGSGLSGVVKTADGVVIQSRTVTNPAIVSGATTSFADGTPLVTEGIQYMTYSFTPQRSDSYIRVTQFSYLSAGAANQQVESVIFVGSTFLARSGFILTVNLNTIYTSTCFGEVASGGTSARNISVRVANNSSGTIFAGRRQSNALPVTPGFMIIEEVVY